MLDLRNWRFQERANTSAHKAHAQAGRLEFNETTLSSFLCRQRCAKASTVARDSVHDGLGRLYGLIDRRPREQWSRRPERRRRDNTGV